MYRMAFTMQLYSPVIALSREWKKSERFGNEDAGGSGETLKNRREGSVYE